LNVDGSNFPSALLCAESQAAGILFSDAGGSVTNANITNTYVECQGEYGSGGYGIKVSALDQNESINITDNTVSSFGAIGIALGGNKILSGNLVSNHIISTLDNLF
jgi:hypothetical protein